jgi:hypothetical protein
MKMTDYETRLNQAQQAERDAASALAKLRGRERQEIAEATAAIHERYREEANELARRSVEASQHLRRVADECPDHPWTGKKVFQVVPRLSRYARRLEGEDRVEGTVETWRSDTPRPGNLSRWYTPNVGQPIVRLHKKDGTPGLKFERLHDGWKLAE